MSTAGSRVRSVDVFRGLTVAAMVIVNNPGDGNNVFAPLAHTTWNGWTPADLIFPFFVFMMGVSITLSARTTGPVTPIFRRGLTLYLLGFLLALYPHFDFATVRIMGVLPRLAICYVAAALGYRLLVTRDENDRINGAAAIAAVLLVAYWAILIFVRVPGGVAGDLTPDGNLGAWIDRHVFGDAHLWTSSRTWDPEGLLSTVPAIATAFTGVAAGVFLRGGRSVVEKTAALIVVGGLLTVLGLGWDQRFPINKSLWTSSYVLLSSGLAAVFLACSFWLIDVRDRSAITRPFVVLGTNALALFVLSGWLVKTLLWIRVAGPDGQPTNLYHWMYIRWFAPLAAPQMASLLFACAMLAVLYGVLEVLYRRKWFLRP